MSDQHAVRLSATRGEPVEFTFDGQPVRAYRGETLAAALLAAGVPGFRADREGRPRRPLCNMGTCFDCVVTVDGAPLVRACLTPVADGLDVRTAKGW